MKQTILVVEDHVDTQNVIRLMLKNDYNLFFANSYLGAFEILTDNSIDMVLLDLSIFGDKDGLEIVRDMRKDELYRETPVIALTAHALPADRRNSIDAGCNDYLTKPFIRQTLVDIIVANME